MCEQVTVDMREMYRHERFQELENPSLHAELWFDDANNHRRGALTMRRLSVMFVLVVLLAGCSSGSSNVPGSTQSTSKAPSSTSPKTTKVAVGTATSFCAAFKEMQSVKASAGAAAAGAAHQTVAAEMRKYAPTAIKAAAVSYANVIDDSGKALKSGTLPSLAVKSADLAKVTAWVSKNCRLK